MQQRAEPQNRNCEGNRAARGKRTARTEFKSTIEEDAGLQSHRNERRTSSRRVDLEMQ